MDKLFSGLVLAALSGLTVLAYKHPAAYSKVSLGVIIGLVCVMIGCNIWNTAVGVAYSKLVKHLKDDAWRAANEEIDRAKVPLAPLLNGNQIDLSNLGLHQ
jgi:hypothetical protein